MYNKIMVKEMGLQEAACFVQTLEKHIHDHVVSDTINATSDWRV